MQKSDKSIYLDYAAATPMDDKVLQAMLPYFSEKFYNPSAIYLKSIDVKKDLEEARHSVAMSIGARSTEIIFTAGGTESINLAINGVINKANFENIAFSSIEHDAVIAAASKYKHQVIDVDERGIVDPQNVFNFVDENTRLVSIIYANNEIGVVQNIREISAVVRQINNDRARSGNRLKLLLHTDASQAPNYLDIHVNKLGVDLMTLNGGKIYGPKQSGILYVRSGIELKPQILGGNQERGLRSGTENVAFAIGFAEALEIVCKKRHERSKVLSEIQDFALKQFKENFPDAKLNGHKKRRLPNNLNYTFDGHDGERIVMKLDELGIECATGSACSARKGESSHVIKALGCSESKAEGSLRFTLGKDSKKSDIDKLISALKQAIG